MATAKKEEVEILSPEVIEAIDKEISLALVSENLTDEILKGLEEKYMNLAINGPEDKEGYLIVQEARKECKKWRVLGKKICEKGREESNAKSRKWIERQKGVESRILAVETPLENMEDEYEAANARKKQLEAQRLAQQNIERTQHMVAFGARIEAGNWVLGDVSYESILVSQCDADIYQGIYEQYKAVFDVNEQGKREEEQRQEDARLELQRQQDDLKRQQQEVKDMRTQARISLLQSLGMGAVLAGNDEAFAYQNVTVWLRDIEEKDVQDWEVIIAGAKEGVEKAKEAAKEAERVREVFRERILKLKEWSSNGQSVYANGGIWGKVEGLVDMSVEGFEKLVQENDSYILEREEEKKRQAKESAIEESRRSVLKSINVTPVVDGLLGKMSDEEWDRTWNEAKADFDNIQQKAVQEKEKERKELLNEKQRYEELVQSIKAIQIPDFRSGQYRGKVNIIRDFIDGLK